MGDYGRTPTTSDGHRGLRKCALVRGAGGVRVGTRPRSRLSPCHDGQGEEGADDPPADGGLRVVARHGVNAANRDNRRNVPPTIVSPRAGEPLVDPPQVQGVPAIRPGGRGRRGGDGVGDQTHSGGGRRRRRWRRRGYWAPSAEAWRRSHSPSGRGSPSPRRPGPGARC